MKNQLLNGTAPLAAETLNQHIDLRPEWLRPKVACQLFGISRSWLYLQLSAGKIKSRSLRQRGAIKGIRLISRDSLAEFIENAQDVIKQ